MVGVRIDRKRKQSVTVLLKALGWTEARDPRGVRRLRVDARSPWRRTTPPARTTRCSTSTASCARASRRPREAAQTLLDNLYFNPKRYDLAKVGRYKINKKLGLEPPLLDQGTLTVDDIVATIKYLVTLHAGEDRCPAARRQDDRRARRGRRHRPLRQPSPAHASASSSRTRSAPGLARMERVVRERMTTQDVEAITPQTLINIRPVVAVDQGVLRHLPAVAVHGPDQPARRPDPQAPPVRARPGWSVP